MYSTLARVKAELKTGTDNATEDAKLYTYLRIVTRRVLDLTGGRLDFEPWYELRYFDSFAQYIGTLRNTFKLTNTEGNHYLLEVDAITVDGTAYTWNTDILPYPRRDTPYKVLRFVAESNEWYPADRTFKDALECVAITGWWGWKERYSTEGWLDSLDTVENNPLAAGGTSITVNDADGADTFSRTPRFSPGNLLRIEDEMLEVTATDTTLNTLTVKRGVRGTTAVAHVQNTTIQVWEPEEDIQRVVERQACALYARRGQFQSAEVGDLGIIQYPPDLMVELHNTMDRYANE